jgi:hypothetical protein
MKKFLLFTLIVVLVAGCTPNEPCPEPEPCPTCPESEEPIYPDSEWDFSSDDLAMILVDSDGNNLLDPDYAGNILDRNITATYKGKTYSVNDATEAGTRAYPPKWYGLRFGVFYGYSGDKGTPALLFGEFEAGTTAEFTIDWGWGQTEFRIVWDLTWVPWTESSGYGTPEQHPNLVPVEYKRIWADGKEGYNDTNRFVVRIIISDTSNSALEAKSIDLEFEEVN